MATGIAPTPQDPPSGGAPNPPKPHNARSRHWYLDEIVVTAFACLGFGGAIFLPLRYGFTGVPPVVVSFLLATGLAALAYRYLGGIQGASLAIGALKLSGSLGALVGIAMLINHELASQVQPPPAAQVWELHGQVTDENGAAIQQLIPANFSLTPPNTRVDPGGNFTLDFYTEPTLAGTGVDFPSLTIESGGLTNTVSLEPEQLKKFPAFKLEDKLRRMHVGNISLRKASLPGEYNAGAAPLQPASSDQLAAYNAPAQPSQPSAQEPKQ